MFPSFGLKSRNKFPQLIIIVGTSIRSPVTIAFTPFGYLSRGIVFVVNTVVISYWLKFPKLVIMELTIIDTCLSITITPLCQTISNVISILDIIISRRFLKTPKLIGQMRCS